MSLLRDGLELSWVNFPLSEYGNQDVAVGIDGVARIVVVDQRGQMSAVPWARVESDDGSEFLVNLATAYSVGLK